MARPFLKKDEETKVLVFRVPESMRLELGFYLATTDFKIAELLRELITDWLDKQRRMF